MDIVRFYNIQMNKIIGAYNNIIYKTAIDLNLKRKDGCSHLFTLGPITDFNAVT